MKPVSVTGNKVGEVLGQTLSKPVTFDYSYEEFENPAEVKDAGKWPNDAEIVSYCNGIAKRNAMAKARAIAVQTEVDRIQETPQFKLDKMVKDIRASNPKLTEEKAKALAESILAMGE